MLVIGVPGRLVRPVNEKEIEYMRWLSRRYVELVRKYQANLERPQRQVKRTHVICVFWDAKYRIYSRSRNSTLGYTKTLSVAIFPALIVARTEDCRKRWIQPHNALSAITVG